MESPSSPRSVRSLPCDVEVGPEVTPGLPLQRRRRKEAKRVANLEGLPANLARACHPDLGSDKLRQLHPETQPS